MSTEMGSDNYNHLSEEIKNFLRFNGYEKTLQSIEEEEVKVMADKQKEEQESAKKQSSHSEVSLRE